MLWKVSFSQAAISKRIVSNKGCKKWITATSTLTLAGMAKVYHGYAHSMRVCYYSQEERKKALFVTHPNKLRTNRFSHSTNYTFSTQKVCLSVCESASCVHKWSGITRRHKIWQIHSIHRYNCRVWELRQMKVRHFRLGTNEIAKSHEIVTS